MPLVYVTSLEGETRAYEAPNKNELQQSIADTLQIHPDRILLLSLNKMPLKLDTEAWPADGFADGDRFGLCVVEE